MHKLVEKIKSGWFVYGGQCHRSPCNAGDLAAIIRKAAYKLRFKELSMEVQLDGELITSEWMESACVNFLAHGRKTKKTMPMMQS